MKTRPFFATLALGALCFGGILAMFSQSSSATSRVRSTTGFGNHISLNPSARKDRSFDETVERVIRSGLEPRVEKASSSDDGNAKPRRNVLRLR